MAGTSAVGRVYPAAYRRLKNAQAGRKPLAALGIQCEVGIFSGLTFLRARWLGV